MVFSVGDQNLMEAGSIVILIEMYKLVYEAFSLYKQLARKCQVIQNNLHAGLRFQLTYKLVVV